MQQAMHYGAIAPGDTLWLAGGTYPGDFVCSLTGTAEQPITIRPLPGQRVTIDGSLTIQGAYTHWHDIEVTHSGWQSRVSAESGSHPVEITAGRLDVFGAGCRLINCVLHDLFGVGVWASGEDATLYGCLAYGNGWSGPDRGHGHALYTQHVAGAPRVLMHNVWHSCFGWGLHAYTQTNGNIDNVTARQNVAYNAGALHDAAYVNLLLGGDWISPAEGAVLDANNTYGAHGIQEYGAGWTGAIVIDNYCPDGISCDPDHCAEYSGNATSAPASGTRITLWPNEYDAGRALLTVYNWDHLDAVAVDVSAVYSAGDTIRARNTQDYYEDAPLLTVAQDGTLTMDMRAASHTVVAPVQWIAPETTFPEFGCWVLERVT